LVLAQMYFEGLAGHDITIVTSIEGLGIAREFHLLDTNLET